jgi:acetyl esterase/lipase
VLARDPEAHDLSCRHHDGVPVGNLGVSRSGRDLTTRLFVPRQEQIVVENRDVLGRSAPVPDLTLSYGPHPDHVADIRLPPATPDPRPAPLLLLFHGGFWRAEYDRAHLGPMASDLAGRGFVVASVEYRRTGSGGGWPTTFTDVADAADAMPALIEQAVPGRFDRYRVVYAGHSAGGHLAVWAALRDRLPAGAPGRSGSISQVTGVLALAPVLDLADAYRLGLDGDAVEALLGGSPEKVPDRYAATDPAALGVPAPQVMLIHGDRDERVPLDMSRRYQAATRSRLVELPGADHFAVIDPASAAWPAILNTLNLLIEGSQASNVARWGRQA